MEFDKKYRIPAGASAVVVPPSVVSDRYVQLAPAYQGGPRMADGADIPVQRTATPAELDDIYRNVNDLDVALGPQGANANGALSRLLKVGADNLDGQGPQVNTTVHDLSLAVSTLSDNRGDLFGTVRNLQEFTTALARNDQQVRTFNTNLSAVATQLAGEKTELAAALHNLAIALAQVAKFVKDNKADLTRNVAGLAEITGVLVQQRAALAAFLDQAPLALGNLNLAYNTSSGTLDTRDNIGALGLGLDKVLCQVLNQDPAALKALKRPKIDCSALSPAELLALVQQIRNGIGGAALPVQVPLLPGSLPQATSPAGSGGPAGGAAGGLSGILPQPAATLDKTLGGILKVLR
jgi:phospholipid/cholesterol/gamma-HCH transport system substrate-binding protein